MRELLKTAIDNNDLRHEMARHASTLSEHGEKILKLEGDGFLLTENVDRVLKHLEDSAITPEEQKRLIKYLDAYESGKQKAQKYYMLASGVIILAMVAGFPAGDILKAVAKKILIALV
jgi:hypothetical protein